MIEKLLLLMSEGRRKRLAHSIFKNKGDFLNTLSGNTRLHHWLKERRRSEDRRPAYPICEVLVQ